MVLVVGVVVVMMMMMGSRVIVVVDNSTRRRGPRVVFKLSLGVNLTFSIGVFIPRATMSTGTGRRARWKRRWKTRTGVSLRSTEPGNVPLDISGMFARWMPRVVGVAVQIG